MAAFCVKGHFSLAALPIVSKQRGYPCHAIRAKTSPELQTKEPKKTPKTISFSAAIDGKTVKISRLPETVPKERKAHDIAGEKNRQKTAVYDEDANVDVPQAETTSEEKEREDSPLRVVDAADDEKAEEEECEDHDGVDDPELEDIMELFVPPGAVVSSDKPLPKLPGSNICLGPLAKGSKVKEVAFVKSSTSIENCPTLKLPEFAMVGRSNVGKSSLINLLVQRKDIAQTSKKPGKTRLINHFIINQSWYLVDLPGYGYAKVPAGVRGSWDHFTKDFFLQSKSLVCVMLLVDASIPPQQIDLEYSTWLYQKKLPMTVVFTKCDRKKKKKNGGRKPIDNIKDFLKLLKERFDKLPPWIMTSCATNQGKGELLMHMAQLRNYWST